MVAFGSQRNDNSVPDLDFFDIPHGLAVNRILWGKYNDRHLRIDQRDGTVLHFTGGIAFGMDVRNLLQFERAFHRHRTMDPSAEIQEIAISPELFGKGCDSIGLIKELIYLIRNVPKLAHMTLNLVFRNGSSCLGQLKTKQVQRNELRGERFRGSNADLRARMRINNAVGLPRSLAPDNIAYRHQVGAFVARFLHGGERVRGLAGLADADDQVPGPNDRIPVSEFGSVVDLNRDAGKRLDH